MSSAALRTLPTDQCRQHFGCMRCRLKQTGPARMPAKKQSYHGPLPHVPIIPAERGQHCCHRRNLGKNQGKSAIEGQLSRGFSFFPQRNTALMRYCLYSTITKQGTSRSNRSKEKGSFAPRGLQWECCQWGRKTTAKSNKGWRKWAKANTPRYWLVRYWPIKRIRYWPDWPSAQIQQREHLAWMICVQ